MGWPLVFCAAAAIVSGRKSGSIMFEQDPLGLLSSDAVIKAP